jgi:tetratricopeptide (TPR) repeat protein
MEKTKGLTYYNLKDYSEAIKYYQKAITINPNDANAYNNMENAYAGLGNNWEQIKCYQQAARLGYQDAQEGLRVMATAGNNN